MNRVFISLGFLSFFIFSCCRNNNHNAVIEFPYMGELNAVDYYVLPFFPLAPMKSYVSGDFMIIQENNPKFNYNVYMLPDFKEGFTGGFTGRGPDEFIFSPTTLSPAPEDGSFEAYESVSNMLIRFSFEDGKIDFMQQERLPLPDGIYGNSMTRLDDNIYLCANDFHNADNELVMIDAGSAASRMIIDYPRFVKEYGLDKDSPFAVVSSRTIVCKPDGSKFGIFYLYYKYFRLFDGEGNRLKEVEVVIKPYTNYNSRNNIYACAYYTYAAASDDYIYAICMNFNTDRKENLSELQVWDWNGNPVACYKFDEPPYYSCISLKNKKLYAFNNLSMEDHGIVKVYNIPSLPKN